MQKTLDTFISVVLICDEYSADTTTTISDILTILKKLYANYEVVVVDNGLATGGLAEIKALLPVAPCIRVIRLAKKVGIDTAVFAGVEAAIGDQVCILYNNDPVALIPEFIEKNRSQDIVFGVATNLVRKTAFERLGTELFYWYNRRFLNINIPNGSTYFICINRGVAHAMTKNSRSIKHFRHLAKLVGFRSASIEYELPDGSGPYTNSSPRELISKAVDVVPNYSSHPLRALSLMGIVAGLLNIAYAAYVVVVRLTQNDIESGWATLSLQNSIMFCMMFVLLAVIAEYVGKILVESRGMPPYHIMQELSSTISIADQTRRNVTK